MRVECRRLEYVCQMAQDGGVRLFAKVISRTCQGSPCRPGPPAAVHRNLLNKTRSGILHKMYKYSFSAVFVFQAQFVNCGPDLCSAALLRIPLQTSPFIWLKVRYISGPGVGGSPAEESSGYYVHKFAARLLGDWRGCLPRGSAAWTILWSRQMSNLCI